MANGQNDDNNYCDRYGDDDDDNKQQQRQHTHTPPYKHARKLK